MKRQRWLQRDRAALAVVLSLVLLALLALGLYLQGKHRWAEQRLAEIEPRQARLAGLTANRQALDAAEAAARARLAEYVYPAAQDLTQAGNDAQQRVRTIFADAGLQVVSSQVLPAKDEKQFDRVPLSVRVEGELAALQRALATLSGQQPAILIDSLSIQPVAAVRADLAPRLGSQFSLSVLRLKP